MAAVPSAIRPDPAAPAPQAAGWRRALRWSPTLGKLIELAFTHTATFAFPLVFAVVCGRTLGLHDYGVVAFYTAMAAFLGMVVEFGFDWYGVREVAPQLDAPARCHRVLVNITATKLLLCGVTLVVTTAALAWHRGLQEWPLMLAWSAYMLGFAADPSWYLRAHERTRLMLAITTTVRLSGIALLLLLVPALATPASALWTYACVSLASSAISWTLLRRQGLVGPAAVEPRYIGQLLRGAWAIVLGNLNGSLLTNGGVALLGLMAEPATVAAANLALRVRMAAEGALLPLNQLGYVRLSARAQESLQATVKLGRKVLIANLTLAIGLSVVCMLAAPAVTRLVFKQDVPLAVGLILLLSLSLPLHSVAGLFGIQSLVALGRERRYALIQITASLVFCAALGAIASPQAYGWAVVAAEAAVLLLSGLTLARMTARDRVPAGGGVA
jgi:O-antigen/teichoic acid export membrane protein